MKLITLDLETFWAPDYSLSKMSPLEYVMDERFQIISLGIKVDNHPTDVFFGMDVERTLAKVKDLWGDALVLAHNNSGFDSYVLTYRLGIKPKMWGCTLAMARPLHAKTCGLSLAALVKHYGLGVKDNAALINTRGKRLEDFTPAELEAMRTYNRDDVEQCHALFHKLKRHISPAEMWQIDAMIRMRTEPAFELDTGLLETTAREEVERKHEMLYSLGSMLGVPKATIEDDEGYAAAIKAELASAPRFSALLEGLGVDVPMKASPTNPEKLIPALSKSDEAFLALLESDNEMVAAAARARLDVKSTLLESRIKSWLAYGRAAGGMMPMPLNYCGADTTGRDSGADSLNVQNQPRVNPDKPKPSDALRMSLRAPKGKMVIVADQSGIELRVNHFLWKVEESMALYEASPDEADLYRAFASDLYGMDPAEIDAQKRQVGKVAQLGLGFGSGAATFQRIARIMGGIDIPVHAVGDELSADKIVRTWRTKYHAIVSGWKRCADALKSISLGGGTQVDDWGLVHTSKEGFVLPSGRLIRYPDLRQEENGTWDDGRIKMSWVYAHGRHKAWLTGPKATENCLAGDTEVLTDSGWKPIVEVLPTDLVHDGDEFVRHDGLIAQPPRVCITVDGVRMTPDHEVLCHDGWKPAAEVTRPVRPTLRHADGADADGHKWAPHAVGVPVRLRKTSHEAGGSCDGGTQAGRNSKLRVRDPHPDVVSPKEARDDQAPRIRGVSLHARPLPTTFAPILVQLRRAWHRGLRAVARTVRELLGGHGAFVPAWAGPGSNRQRWAVQPGELSMDRPANQHHEQAQLRARGGHTGFKPGDGNRQDDAVQQAQSWVAGALVDHTTGLPQPVYDLRNCGPRHRFVVRGASGPLIVHNCVQALARDSIFDCALEYYKRTGLRPALRVHDELVYVVEETHAQKLLDELQAVLRTPPRWWPELVVWSEGDAAESYGSAK